MQNWHLHLFDMENMLVLLWIKNVYIGIFWSFLFRILNSQQNFFDPLFCLESYILHEHQLISFFAKQTSPEALLIFEKY